MTVAVGLIGAGRMGSAIALRLLEQGHPLLVSDPSPAAQERVAAAGRRSSRRPTRWPRGATSSSSS